MKKLASIRFLLSSSQGVGCLFHFLCTVKLMSEKCISCILFLLPLLFRDLPVPSFLFSSLFATVLKEAFYLLSTLSVSSL